MRVSLFSRLCGVPKTKHVGRACRFFLAVLVLNACIASSVYAQTVRAQIGYGDITDTVAVTYSGGCEPYPPFNYSSTNNITVQSLYALRKPVPLDKVNGQWQPVSVSAAAPTEIYYPQPRPIFNMTASLDSGGVVTVRENGGPFTYTTTSQKTVYQSVSVVETIDLNTGKYQREQVEDSTVIPATTDGCQSALSAHGETTDDGYLKITLNPVTAGPLSITPTPLAAATFKGTYSSSLVATGGTPQYAWSASGLPSGLSITTDAQGNGRISGTLAADAEDTSSFDRIKRQFSIIVTVTDSAGQKATSNPPLIIGFSCGDDRDKLIQQYSNFGVRDNAQTSHPWPQFYPRCKDFTQSASSTYYSFPDFNTPSPGAGAEFDWALVRGPLVVPTLFGLDAWIRLLGLPRTINSAYRDPAQNAVAGGVATSRHMFGDAVDLRNQVHASGSRKSCNVFCLAEYNKMVKAAWLAGASYVEPPSLPCAYNCVHADWRTLPGSYVP